VDGALLDVDVAFCDPDIWVDAYICIRAEVRERLGFSRMCVCFSFCYVVIIDFALFFGSLGIEIREGARGGVRFILTWDLRHIAFFKLHLN
jgi:hypothetical protein